MKYFKISAFVLFAAFTFAFVSAKAEFVYINGITIPMLRGTYTTNTKLMKHYEYKPQRIKKESATDNITGGPRAVSARTRLNTHPYTVSIYKKLGSSEVNFNTLESLTPGLYQAQIRADKSTIATITFWGYWFAD